MIKRTFFIKPIVFLLFMPGHSYALTIDLPEKKSSSQWKVRFEKPKLEKQEIIKMQHSKNKYNVYRLTIKNIGKEANDIQVEAFKPKKGSNKRHELFTDEGINSITNKNITTFVNLPVSTNADEIDIYITWKDKNNSQRFKQTFVFKQS